MSAPFKLRDSVHNIIVLDDNKSDNLLVALINTPEFQRLRRIKQLGFCDYVFPGATHTRFSHSIGVMWVARAILGIIGKYSPIDITEEEKTWTLCAALLHDIGHGPFSHAFEKITKRPHERWTTAIINDPATSINKVLREHSRKAPEYVSAFFDPTSDEAQTLKGYLKDIVSSQLDADRFDYLIRDSHATGTSYGQFDYPWLCQHIRADIQKDRLFLSQKASSAAQTYLYARYHMYMSVYFHKATRAVEVILRLVLKRYKELLEEGKIPRTESESEKALRTLLAGSSNIVHYSTLDDFAMYEIFKGWTNSEDGLLSDLSNRILNRCLYKCIDTTQWKDNIRTEFTSEVKIRTRQLFANSDEYYFHQDTSSDIPYKPYDPDEETPEKQIYIETTAGTQKEISRVYPTLTALRDEYSHSRYFYHPSILDVVAKAKMDYLDNREQ